MPLDPISLIPSGLSTLGGIVQSIIGGGRERRAENALQNLQTPTYTPSKSILDYYNEALQRYNINPYQTPLYQTALQQSNRNMAAGLQALQSRRNAIGGISQLTAQANQGALNAGLQAENLQNQRFGQLGQAAGMKQAEDRYGFQINQMLPYEKQYALLAAKAGGGANILNAGLQNIGAGLNAGSMLLGDYYSNNPQSARTVSNPSSGNYYIPPTYGQYKSSTDYFNK